MNSAINQQLLEILACPETKQKLSLLPNAEVDKLNERIKAGGLKNRSGQIMTEKIDAALVREDQLVAYPVRAGIPVMLIEEAFSLS